VDSQFMKSRKSSNERSAKWGELPHPRLCSEIAQRAAYRASFEANTELRLQELSTSLPQLRREEHQEYSRLVSAEIIRELRICRDVYREYFAKLNNKSRTAKWGVALDYAVAPRASHRLCQEVCAYLHSTKVNPLVVEVLFAYSGRLVLTEHGVKTREARSIEEIIGTMIPDASFQHLKKQFERESFPVGGPFSSPQFSCGLSFGLRGGEIIEMYQHGQIWISSAGRMWDCVLREIMAQQVQIDLEERSDALSVLDTLSLFERHAGVLYSEARDRYTTLPDEVWKKIGEEIDALAIPIEANLERAGRDVLRKLAKHGTVITSWSVALVSKSDFDVLPTKDVIEGKVKYIGNLSRHTKRAFYRAAEVYNQVIDRVYDRRISP
jgi:hypothetical protein